MWLMMDTLKAMRVFVAIAHHGSLARAADQLDYSRAMVSRYLHHLEHTFSIRLFQRNTRKISLTPSGEKALRYCENILQQQLLLHDLAAHEQQSGSIRLTCGLFLYQLGLNRCLRAFQAAYPQIQFDLTLTENALDLIDGNIDLALRITQKIADGLIARPIYTIASTFCAHPDYLAQAPELNHPSQLLQHACISHQHYSQYWTLIDAEQHPQNYPIQSSFKSNDVNALYDMCINGQGIAMLPSLLVQQDLAIGRLVRVLPEYTAIDLSLSLVYASRQHLPQMTQILIAFLMEHLGNYLNCEE